MPRPRKFEIDDVVRKTLMVFWRQGYESTSLADIEAATGVARMSLYNVFGDKLGLFHAVLERYTASTRRLYQKYLANGGFAGLDQLLRAYAAPEKLGEAGSWGCLMLNTISSVEGVSPQAHQMVEDFRQHAIQQIEGVLLTAVEKGEIAGDLDCREFAEFVLITMWGAKAAIRHAGDVNAAAPVLNTLARVLRGLRTNAAASPADRPVRRRRTGGR